MKNIFINSGIALLGLFVAAVITEAGLRIFKQPQLPLALKNYFEADPVAGFDIIPNMPPEKEGVDNISYEAWSNNIGCFDAPYNGEDVSALLVGDSFTWGVAPFEDKWGKVLEDEIRGRVLKCGVLGYGTKQELLKAQKVLSKTKKPRLIVVGYFVNDLGDDYIVPSGSVIDGVRVQKRYLADIEKGGVAEVRDEELSKRAAGQGQRCVADYLVSPVVKEAICFAENFELFKLFKQPLKTMVLALRGEKETLALVPQEHKSFWQLGMMAFLPQDRYPWLKDVWENHLENIKKFKELSQKEGAQLLFVLIPIKESLYTFLDPTPSPFIPEGVDFNNLYATLEPFLQKEKIEYINLLPLMKQYADEKPRGALNPAKDFYYKKDGHWTSKGNKLAGLLVSRYIMQNDLLPMAAEIKTDTLKEIEEELSKFSP